MGAACVVRSVAKVTTPPQINGNEARRSAAPETAAVVTTVTLSRPARFVGSLVGLDERGGTPAAR